MTNVEIAKTKSLGVRSPKAALHQ